MEVAAPATIEWGVASTPLAGETSCGDLHVLKRFPGGVLVAAVDGVGHGAQAASAADIVRRVLEEQAGEPLETLVRCCHGELKGSRGVVMSLGAFHPARASLRWLGVGNVLGVVLRNGNTRGATEESLLLRGGVVGGQLPPLQATELPISAGDTLVFATDGVAGDFARGLARNLPPQKGAEAILAGYGRPTDDALVLVARYVGG